MSSIARIDSAGCFGISFSLLREGPEGRGVDEIDENLSDRHRRERIHQVRKQVGSDPDDGVVLFSFRRLEDLAGYHRSVMRHDGKRRGERQQELRVGSCISLHVIMGIERGSGSTKIFRQNG